MRLPLRAREGSPGTLRNAAPMVAVTTRKTTSQNSFQIDSRAASRSSCLVQGAEADDELVEQPLLYVVREVAVDPHDVAARAHHDPGSQTAI